jgi:hypothetical protein
MGFTTGQGLFVAYPISMRVVESCMKSAELKRAVELAADHQAEFMRRWHEFFNKG